MNKIVLLSMLFLSMLVIGCNKNQPVADATDAGDGMPVVERTEIATGDLKDILMALKRIHFAFDSSELVVDAQAALDEAADKLRVNTDVNLYVDGHSDDRGTTEYNMSLGERRSQTVIAYLKNSGVDTVRLKAVSFGEEKPLKAGAGEKAHAYNRRVDFRLMRGTVQFILAEGQPVTDGGVPIKETEEPLPSTTAEVAPAETAETAETAQ